MVGEACKQMPGLLHMLKPEIRKQDIFNVLVKNMDTKLHYSFTFSCASFSLKILHVKSIFGIL